MERGRRVLFLELVGDDPGVHHVGTVGKADCGAGVVFQVAWGVGVVWRDTTSWS